MKLVQVFLGRPELYCVTPTFGSYNHSNGGIQKGTKEGGGEGRRIVVEAVYSRS